MYDRAWLLRTQIKQDLPDNRVDFKIMSERKITHVIFDVDGLLLGAGCIIG